MTHTGRAIVKSNKATILKRVEEVLRILLAGGEFEDIRQYASAHEWRLSDRQLRRYQERAYRKLASHAQRDRQQLLGRHLMQRRALYARALKNSDIRTALGVLRDEAALEGLYDFVNQGHPLANGATSSIPRRERFRRLLTARMKEDEQQITLLEESSPTLWYAMPDTRMAETMLHTMALMHAGDQLDRAAMVLLATWRISQHDPRSEFWEQMGAIHAWNFATEQTGWRLFVDDLGVDPTWLIAANHHGSFLELFSEQVAALRPDTGQLEAIFASMGEPDARPVTAQTVARGWRQMLDDVLDK